MYGKDNSHNNVNTMTLRSFSKIFFTGLAAILPIVVTVSLLWWLGSSAERMLGKLFRLFIPDAWYLPGMGLLLGVALTFLAGLLAHAILFRRVFLWWDSLFNRIPLVKTVYGAAQDFMQFVSREDSAQFNRVVLVEFDAPKAKLIGFVTRENFEGLPQALGEDGQVAVYFPMSYQIGGYTLFLPKSRLKPLDISMEDAMRFVVTAGLSAGKTQ